MAQPTHISAPLHLTTLQNSTTYLLADFYADWCGPCKQVAPYFSKLAAENTVPGTLGFVKINVDEQPEISQKYSIRTIPTFILFKDGKIEHTINAANPAALRAAVQKVQAELAAAKEQQKPAANESTVSGSYGLTGGNSWKMSLN